jgi:hypothetical protein
MKRWAFFFLSVLSISAMAEHNTTIETDGNTTNKAQLQKHLQEELKREANFAKTQTFQMGDDYNLSEHQVDPKDVESVPVIEPEYDFNMDDVYD